jgi:hypothetical protein
VTPASASTWLAERLNGSAREVPVVAAGPHAVYVRDGDACLAVFGRHAVAVPIGLGTDLPAIPAARSAYVGDGCIRLGSLIVTATRLISYGVPVLRGLRTHAAVVRSWLTRGHDPRLDGARAQLPTTALAALMAGDTSGLVGRGDGFTPVGDDVVCGWLVTRRALGRPTRVQPALQRTTDVSGTLVRRACEGEAIPQLGHLLNAVADGAGAPQVHHRLENLLRVGSSSGAGLAIGAATALLHQEARR